MKANVLKVHPKDNVLVALQNLAKGQVVPYNGVEYTLQDAIGAKHKFLKKKCMLATRLLCTGYW